MNYPLELCQILGRSKRKCNENISKSNSNKSSSGTICTKIAVPVFDYAAESGSTKLLVKAQSLSKSPRPEPGLPCRSVLAQCGSAH
eukprot:393602-Rhodomonas_salina.3